MWTDQIWGSMPIKNMSRKKAAKIENCQEALNWLEDLTTTALNQFEWHDLPNTCDARMIERSALLYGRYMIARLDGAYISPACVPGASFNLYGYPRSVWGWGFNGFNHEFKSYLEGEEEKIIRDVAGTTDPGEVSAVVGYDNIDAYPYINYIVQNALRLSDIIRAADVAVQNMKSLAIIFCDDTQVKTINEILNRREENVATVIAVKNSITAQDIKCFPVQMQKGILADFWTYFENIRNITTELFGQSSNPNEDKRERLLVDEVNANNESTYDKADKRLRMRQKFCDQVNKVFGLNISVTLRKEVYIKDENADPSGLDDGEPGPGGRDMERPGGGPADAD